MSKSLLEYYQENSFNPVKIPVEDKAAWDLHVAKRLNLYEKHLGIPVSMLRGMDILEFGSNSGENALVLASFGAHIDLVEPNEQVHPRLRDLFRKFGLDLESERFSLFHGSMAEYPEEHKYDLVLAEGFLFTLPNREEMLKKMGRLLNPGGIAVTSFHDKYGMLIETLKRFTLHRSCEMMKVGPTKNDACLDIAKQLFEQDFNAINASRPFKMWWEDVLINPHISYKNLWTYEDILPLIEEVGCEFKASSPRWDGVDHFDWYKNVADRSERHGKLMTNWQQAFPFFINGVGREDSGLTGARSIDAVGKLVERLFTYIEKPDLSANPIDFTLELRDFFIWMDRNLGWELETFFHAAYASSGTALIEAYQNSPCLRSFWGVPYHYFAFSKPLKGDS